MYSATILADRSGNRWGNASATINSSLSFSYQRSGVRSAGSICCWCASLRRMAPWVLGRAYGGAPVSDPLSGFRAYRLIVLKKALAEFRGRPFLTTDSWASNVELLGLVAPHARQIAEAPVTLRYDVHGRPSRLSTVRTLRGLLRVRRERWEGPVREGKQ